MTKMKSSNFILWARLDLGPIARLKWWGLRRVPADSATNINLSLKKFFNGPKITLGHLERQRAPQTAMFESGISDEHLPTKLSLRMEEMLAFLKHQLLAQR